jgi:poly-beta-1,6-N-acetyl-D-glucosamine biosynthesis protein PgaD
MSADRSSFENQIVIEHRVTIRRPRQCLEYLITASGWMFLSSFLLQIGASIFLWVLGIRQVRVYLVSRPEIFETLRSLKISFLVAMICLVVFVGWAQYNKHRYGSLRRRRFPPDVTRHELAERLGTSEREIATLQEAKWIDWPHG